MEEKLPNDKLEDFLKKSFEDYTESPPGDLWDKIESGLAPAPKPFIFRGWWIAAAAAVVLGIFLAQHFYFENKIDRLTRELEKNSVELQGLETNEQDGKVFQAQQLESDQSLPLENLPQASADPPAAPPEVKQFPGETAPEAIEKTTEKSEIILKKQPNRDAGLATENIENEVVNPLEVQNSNPSAIQMETAVTDIPNSVSNPASSGRLAAPELLDLINSKVTPEHFKTLKPNLYQLSTDPVAYNRLSAGVRVMPMATKDRITQVRPDIFHHRPGGPDKFVNNQQVVSGQSLVFGATLGYELDDHLSLVSGLDYRRTETSSSHRTEFMFKEQMMPMGHHHGGTEELYHDFSYNLNTASGLVEVEVRVEAADTTLPIPDNEVLAFKVNTNKVTSHLSIPLAFKYNFGKGRLHGYLKGGVTFNFLLNDVFEIKQVQSLNDHFRISPARSLKGTPQNLKSVSMNYLAAAGVEYDLTKSVSLSVEPTFMGSLGSEHSANFIRSSSYMVGVSAGLNYQF